MQSRFYDTCVLGFSIPCDSYMAVAMMFTFIFLTRDRIS